MNQNKTTQKFLTSLLLWLCLLHQSSSTKSFYAQHPQLFYYSLNGKVWEPLKLSNDNFYIVREFEHMDKYEDPNTVIDKDFKIYLKLDKPGWIVKKGDENSESKIEVGDYVNLQLSKSKGFYLETFSISEKAGVASDMSDWNLLDFVNSKFQVDSLPPLLPVKQYFSAVEANALVKSYQNNESLLKVIQEEKRLDNLFSFKTLTPYTDMLKNEKHRNALFKKMVEETLKTIYVRQEWSKISNKKFKAEFKEKVAEAAEALVKNGEEYMKLLSEEEEPADPPINLAQFADLLGNFMGNTTQNLMLVNIHKIYGGADRFWPSQSDWPFRQRGIVLLLKHRLVSAIYLRFTSGQVYVGANRVNADEVLASLIPPENGEFKNLIPFVTDLVPKMAALIEIFANSRWLSVYYWMTRIKDIDDILTRYVSKTARDPLFASICVKDSFLKKNEFGWSSDVDNEVDVALLKVDGRRILV